MNVHSRVKAGLIFLCCLILTGGIYFNRASAAYTARLYAKKGGHDDDHGDRHHSGYYKHYRYYPRGYYHYKKIYYYPKRVYYYYYDFVPGKVYYYEGEKGYVSNNPDYLALTSIANMASQGVPDSVIISEIERTHSVYKLNSEIIAYLKQNNVSDRVVDFMMSTGKK